MNGPSGKGVADLFNPEINSTITPLPTVPGCAPLPDQAVAKDSGWTKSFQNIQCYDSLKVQAVINEIDGKSHDGSVNAPVPNILGMNFQAVSVGQKLGEADIKTQGGYLDAAGTPTPALLGEIQFVDASIGKMVAELKAKGLYNSTLIIITAKHGQSPININSLVRIRRDNKALRAPSDVLGNLVAQSAGGRCFLDLARGSDPDCQCCEYAADEPGLGRRRRNLFLAGPSVSYLRSRGFPPARYPGNAQYRCRVYGRREESLRAWRVCERRYKCHYVGLESVTHPGNYHLSRGDCAGRSDCIKGFRSQSTELAGCTERGTLPLPGLPY